MYLGVDVGGTHTDAALLSDSIKLVKTAKTPTLPDLSLTLETVLNAILAGTEDPKAIRRLTVSTTLGLNAVLTGQSERVGLIYCSGPGLPWDDIPSAPWRRKLSGSQDHLGVVLKSFAPGEAARAAAELRAEGAASLVCAAKFGPKNPALEDAMAAEAQERHPGEVFRASALFGGLNFPRRIASALLNASVAGLYRDFAARLLATAQKLGLRAELFILQSDGGVLSAPAAAKSPALALSAGPAASLLGLWALGLHAPQEDLLMVDMGGTSADLALISRGKPLLAPQGLTVNRHKTLIRGLLSHSLALGGDTDLLYRDGVFEPLPVRRGPALALDPLGLAGRRLPTLTDATNVLRLSDVGDRSLSVKAFAALAPQDPRALARAAIKSVFFKLKRAINSFIDEVNSAPIYTIGDFLVDWKVAPRRLAFLGGPAPSLVSLAQEYLGLEAFAPPEASFANALGAALARPTMEAELYADTSLGTMTIPTLGVKRDISANYDLGKAVQDLLAALQGLASEPQITLAESFDQMTGRGVGKIIRVKAQTAPGLLAPPLD
ncbi:MAG: hypothetical protein LBO66_00710 [Deltaproteobacteria bacterium]|jgi:N-methylhydantoinase A/oxoprolinase/acetone carboxylase beta subunit|nr:hypothetical protein [Deltaproteobacteria bacterium]